MTKTEKFRAVYEQNGVDDRLLSPHFSGGVEDAELVADRLSGDFGPPRAELNIVEFGCGTGRVTIRLAPYLLLDGLRHAEEAGRGILLHTRIGGTTLAPTREAARWFSSIHLKSFPRLVHDPDVQAQIAEFIGSHETPGGAVAMSTGVNIFDFRALETARR